VNTKAIGGSDIAAIMGLHPHRTAYDVWLRIVQGFEQEDSPILRRGRVMEPVVRELARTELGLQLTGPKYLEDNQHGFLARASLDDLAGEEPVELKTVSSFARQQWGDETTQEVPLHYLYQLQWYLWAAKAPRGHLVALIGLDDLRHYRIQADPALHGRMISAARAFWERYIVGGEAPSPEGSYLASEWVARKYDSPTEDFLSGADVPGIEGLLKAYWVAKEMAEEAEERVEKIKLELKEKIGNARGIKTQAATISWARPAPRTVVDWEAVARELNVSPVLIEKYTSQKEGSRVFRVTARGQQ
jgi:putative phage-type endonuclease